MPWLQSAVNVNKTILQFFYDSSVRWIEYNQVPYVSKSTATTKTDRFQSNVQYNFIISKDRTKEVLCDRLTHEYPNHFTTSKMWE